MPTAPLHNEPALLRRIADGDEHAFTILVDHYWNKIYSVALVFTKSTENSKDIVQDVFLKVWSKRAGLPEVRKFESWLFITARNEILNLLRKKGPVFPGDDRLLQHAGRQDLSSDEALHLKQLQALIRKGIDLLPPQQKLVYQLSREQGLSHEEIGEKLGLARSTVKNTLVKALAFLRAYIQEHENLFLIGIALLLDRF